MDEPKYTEPQLLCGLREVWRCMTGADAPFDASTRIDVYMKSIGEWEEMDFGDVFRTCERFFGFACSDAEWSNLIGFQFAKRSFEEWERTVAPKLTFGALAQFISNRVEAVSLRPTKMLGRECRPAGVFLGVHSLANRGRGTSHHFGPSTPIISELRGHALDDFWTQLRWITQHNIPELPSFWREITQHIFLFGCLGVIAALVATLVTRDVMFFVVAGAVAVVGYVLASVFKHLTNPLPSEIVTFRDLSILISNSDCDAVRA